MMSGEEGIEIETEHVRLLPVTSGGGGRYLLRVGDLSALATGAFSGGMLWMTPILFVRLSGGTMDWRAQDGRKASSETPPEAHASKAKRTKRSHALAITHCAGLSRCLSSSTSHSSPSSRHLSLSLVAVLSISLTLKCGSCEYVRPRSRPLNVPCLSSLAPHRASSPHRKRPSAIIRHRLCRRCLHRPRCRGRAIGRAARVARRQSCAATARLPNAHILRSPRKPSPPSSPWYEQEMRAFGGSAR